MTFWCLRSRRTTATLLRVLSMLMVLSMVMVLLAAKPVLATASTRAAMDAGSALPVSSSEEHVVLAYYYSWWEAATLARAINQPVRFPSVPFGQVIDDDALVREHIREAQAAGIGGFVVTPTRDLPRLLAISQEVGFRVTVQVDATQDVEQQLTTFAQAATHPALVRYQGRPVVFFWRAAAVPDAQWRALRYRLDPDHGAVWLADGDNFTLLRSDVWDGISPYQIAWSPTPQTQLPAWGAQATAVAPGKLYVPPVAPGCNDAVMPTPTCQQDRRDGDYYQLALQGALASQPRWAVIVSTFNEWLEDTQIEPSPTYGDRYLQLTRQFADTFTGLVAAPCC